MSKKPVPKKKQAVSSTRSRYAKYSYKKRIKLANGVALGTCKDCGEVKKAHFVCEACGKYNGRQVLEVKTGAAPVAEIQA